MGLQQGEREREREREREGEGEREEGGREGVGGWGEVEAGELGILRTGRPRYPALSPPPFSASLSPPRTTISRGDYSGEERRPRGG